MLKRNLKEARFNRDGTDEATSKQHIIIKSFSKSTDALCKGAGLVTLFYSLQKS
jgi:hypothetical protein